MKEIMIKNQLFFPLGLVLNFFILVSSITYAQDIGNLKKVSLNVENLFLFKISIEEKTKSIPTKSLKFKIYLNLRAITKKNTKNQPEKKYYAKYLKYKNKYEALKKSME